MFDTNSSRRKFIRTATVGAAGLAISSSALSSAPQCTVNINFEGMMVFHKYQDEYEVGIVDRSIALKHELSVLLNEANLFEEQLSKRGSRRLSEILRFDVKKHGVLRKDIGVMKEGHGGKRLQDDEDGQFDFDWLFDFEGKELHRDRVKDCGQGRELRMEPNKMELIIRMSYGRLYTKYKIAKLKRTRGTRPDNSDFGFVAESVTCQINLKPHEELVGSFQGQEASIPYEAGKTTNIDICNVIPLKDRSTESHFRHYYRLFPDLYALPEEQYEIELADPPVLPHNHYPLPYPTKSRPMTVGDYPCGGILLGTRTQELK